MARPHGRLGRSPNAMDSRNVNPPKPPSNAMGKTVLIVDDAVVMRMMIKGILAKNGFEVVGEAQNGVEAVEKYRALVPDLVTMDMVMPEMDGITAVKQIVAGDPNARIIMCTSMRQQALLVAAIQAGVK